MRPGPGIGRNGLREELDREVRDEPEGPLLPPVEGPELMVILRLGHPVAGRRGAGAPTAAKDLVGGGVEVASRWWRCLPVVGSMTLDHRPDRARRPDRRNATALKRLDHMANRLSWELREGLRAAPTT